MAVAASVAIAGLIGLSALSGMLPIKRAPMRDEVPVPRGESKPGQPRACGVCGTIESIRTVEVLDEAGRASGAAVPKSGADADGVRKRQVFRVTLRMDDGSFRAISQSSPPAFAVGDKVRVVEGRLVRA
jgi:outer membrane lipoprotein SlyB